MISHSRTWLEIKVGDDPRHQHVMEVILQVRPCDIGWFQEHATTARQDLMHLLSTVILPRSPCGEDELEAYYRKRGYLLPLSPLQQKLQQQQQQQAAAAAMNLDSKRGKLKRVAANNKKGNNKRQKQDDNSVVANNNNNNNNNNAKKKAKKVIVAADKDDEDDDDDDEEEEIEKQEKQDSEKANNKGGSNQQHSNASKSDADETFHQAFGEIIRIVYRTEPISSSLSSSTTATSGAKSGKGSASQQSTTLFWRKSDDNDNSTSLGLLQQLPKLSHRFWLWCFPKHADDVTGDSRTDLTLHPGWRRQDMIPMSSLFRPPADH